MAPIITSTAASNGTAAGAGGAGLTGGQIAGIVVGSVVGALLLLGLVIGACILLRRRKQTSPATSIFNQPSPSRSGGGPPTMTYVGSSRPSHQAQEPVPGARVARMTALNGASSEENSSQMGERPRGYLSSSGEEYGDSPESRRTAGMLGVAQLPKRHRSLNQESSSSPRPETAQNNSSGNEYDTSPEAGALSGQSEQLPFFKDYYSQDEIHADHLVATLWAYQPRANDEFELERGDMLRVIGIWDDGWATGVRVPQRAEQWDARRHQQRDSGVSNGSRRPGSSDGPPGSEGESPPNGEIKAFPVSFVCPLSW